MALGATQDDVQTYHDLTAHEALLLLESDHEAGLDQDEARRRLARYGPNTLPQARRTGPVRRFLRQLDSPLVWVLILAGVVTFIMGESVDAAVVFGVVVINAIIGYVQESKAESALDALRSMVHTSATVIRSGTRRSVASEELVPGDLVLVEAGDRVPADMRLIRESQLKVDESALTGESLPADKDPHLLGPDTVVADRVNMVYSGTVVTNGSGAGIVVATGSGTEIGEIHRLVGSTQAVATPLTRKLSRFSAQLTIVILALAIVAFVFGVAQGEPANDVFVAVVALAVGAIPEGLPAAVAITLAIGVSRMARRRAVIRRLPVVETLGSATVICSDKTGTLTENRMTVQTIWTVDQEVAGTGAATGPASHDRRGALQWCLLVGANCTDAWLAEDGVPVGDPTETAMLTAAQQHGVAVRGLERTGSLPFSSERQIMATTHVDPRTGVRLLMVKGAVERVLNVSAWQAGADGTTTPVDEDAVLAAAEGYAKQGMRVLATAIQLHPEEDVLDRLARGEAGGLVFTGLQAMIDPPRSTATAAVRSCHEAGLAVKMITGDHATTAGAIARQLGILAPDDPGVLTGSDIARLDDEALADAVQQASVFARVTPDQKLRLVRALQSRDHVVAMTGDGVNDAPALKQADIGIAMGMIGTEAAKDAADMVLVDDDFATIEAAVEEGRGVFDNLTKFIVWTLPTNMGEGLVVLAAILVGAELPILPTQILWINMTTAVALGLTLAWEPKEPGIMSRPPRDPREPLFGRPLVIRTALVSVLLLIGSWSVYLYEVEAGASLEVSRTAAVNVFVMVEAFYLFSCRTLTRPGWHVGLFTNPYLVVGVALQTVGQLALTYVPAMNTLFQTAPLGWGTWLRITAVAIVAAAVVALHKHLANSRTLRT